MNTHRKTAAFLVGLLLCFGNTAAPVMSGYAVNDDAASVSADGDILGTADDPDAGAEMQDASEEGGFLYEADSNGNAVIVGCTLEDKEITVPDTLGGMPVTELATDAFLGSHAEKIIIPAGIEYISTDNPFASCLNLLETEVSPDNANYCTKDGVLYNKDMTMLVHYPAANERESYTVPDSVTEIGVAGFAESRLKHITLPDSLTTIGRHSFSFCQFLEEIDMSGTSIEYVDVMSFINDISLTSVKFSDSTDGIGLAAFFGCSKLAEIELPPNVTYIRQSAFAGTALKQVEIPASIEEIGYCAFGYNENEEMDSDFVIIGTSGTVAEQYCKDSDTEYGYTNDFTFKSVEVAEAEEEYSKLDRHSFEDYEYALIDGEAYITFCVSMDDVITVPAEVDGHSVAGLYKGAFSTNEASEIILPDGLKTIGENMFSSKLKKLTIPGSCENIEGVEPFVDCAELEEINVTDGEGAYSSADGVLYDSDKKTLLVYPRGKTAKKFKAPAETEEINTSAFCGNAFLEEADLSHIKKIDDYAFETCGKLGSVRFSKELESVGYRAFFACPELKSVRLGEKLDFIGDYAFGFVYDQQLAMESQEDPYSVVEDYTIYAKKDSTAYKYAKACGINVVTNTVGVADVNVNRGFLYVIIGMIAAAVLAVIGVATGKSVKKKKASRPAAKKAAKPEKAEEAPEDSDEEADDEAEE
ncbi:MAG: leucine-rich repeat domain-containing protein [Ruminococcus sp.]|nr:leucine-rich repeat domain-containing protein [Ruminococcus sp.]